jgi:spore coat protein U-like protein
MTIFCRARFGAIFGATQLIPRACRSKRAIVLRWIFAAALATTAQHGWSAQCSLSILGVNFGSYDVFNNVGLDSTGNIGVTCDMDTPYSLSLSPGGGSYASRLMADGPNLLGYNLYTEAARAVIWGDGTGGTGVVSGSGTTGNHTVYGRISARQNVSVGSYSDSITVTVNF